MADLRKKKGRRKKASGKASPKAIMAAKRRSEALDYRLQGFTFEQIGESMGVSAVRAFQLVTEGLTTIQTENAQQVKDIEVKRLDLLTTAYMQNATQGDVVAANMVIRLSERRAKLLGLDGPIKHELTGKDGKPIETEAKVNVETARSDLLTALQKAGVVVPPPIPEQEEE